jgi:hypothetical protein
VGGGGGGVVVVPQSREQGPYFLLEHRLHSLISFLLLNNIIA